MVLKVWPGEILETLSRALKVKAVFVMLRHQRSFPEAIGCVISQQTEGKEKRDKLTAKTLFEAHPKYT